MAADHAALLGAAIRAAVLAKAPRRTVQAIASAVTGVLVRSAGEAVPQAGKEELAEDTEGQPTLPKTGASLEELVAARREARIAKRRRKKVNRLARLRAAAPDCEGRTADAPPMRHEEAAQDSDMEGSVLSVRFPSDCGSHLGTGDGSQGGSPKDSTAAARARRDKVKMPPPGVRKKGTEKERKGGGGR